MKGAFQILTNTAFAVSRIRAIFVRLALGCPGFVPIIVRLVGVYPYTTNCLCLLVSFLLSWFDWGHHLCMFGFLEASHFPRLCLIDFFLIMLVFSGNDNICLGVEYFSLKFICSRTFPLFCKLPCVNCLCSCTSCVRLVVFRHPSGLVQFVVDLVFKGLVQLGVGLPSARS